MRVRNDGLGCERERLSAINLELSKKNSSLHGFNGHIDLVSSLSRPSNDSFFHIGGAIFRARELLEFLLRRARRVNSQIFHKVGEVGHFY